MKTNEELNEILNNAPLEYTTIIEDPSIDENRYAYYKKIKASIDQIGSILEFVSEEKKETMLGITISNLDYEKNEDGTFSVCVDMYDWNDICMYHGFAKWYLTGEAPIHMFENGHMFADYNKEQFENFKIGKHEVVKMPSK